MIVFESKKLVLSLIVIFFAVNGFCQKTIIVSGEFKGLAENDKVYLYSTKNFKDSTYIRNGTFKFANLNISEQGIYFIMVRHKLGRYDFPLFLAENTNLYFSVNADFSEYKISGDKNAQEQNDFYQGKKTLSKKLNLIQKEISLTTAPDKRLKLKEKESYYSSAVNDFAKNWVTQHKSSPFSVAIIRLFIAQNLLVGTEDILAEKYFDMLLPKAKENNSETDIVESGFEFYNSKYSKMKEGSIVPDFIIKDTSNKNLSITDLGNNYLLLDFWASWCAPCRANTPLLKELYDEFKGKGFLVLSISMDTDIKKWKSAIHNDNMDWFQGSDLLGQDAGIGQRYRVTAVPTYILVGPDKKIILKSIGGDINLIRTRLNEIYNQ